MNNSFSTRLLKWFDQHGRKDLPWQNPQTPYRVWVSEIMLQQTQVSTVIPYFLTFIARFPDVQTLAQAEQAEVLNYWSGLGYYARCRNLHKSAQQIVNQHQGEIPATAHELMALSGIGKSTAHAILSLAYHQPKAICDGNVKRVLARWTAQEEVSDKAKGIEKLWQMAETLQSNDRPADYTQAIMDLGAILCTRANPKCDVCPLAQDCQALHLAQTQEMTVTQFPRKSQKTQKPEKSCAMYLLQHPDGSLWLNAPEKEEGLWGGLYQLPQTMPTRLLHTEEKMIPLETTQHIFTHFKLNIQPYWQPLTTQEVQLLSHQQGDWYHPQQQNLPRPAIVDKLIKQIQSASARQSQLF